MISSSNNLRHYKNKSELHDEDEDSSVMSLGIATGDIVVLQEMKTSPELNGKIAKVKHESNEGQWLVQIHGTGEKILVDADNLLMGGIH